MDATSLGTRRESEGLWDWNLVSNRIHFSPRWISLVGCKEHEIDSTRDAWLQRVHPDDLSEVSRAIDTHLTDGPSEFDLRHRMLHKDGSYRWMSCRGVVQRNETGEAVRVLGSHADLTADTVTDPATGLPNGLLFLDRLTRSVERSTRYPGFNFSVVLVDLDRPADAEEPSRSTARDPLLSAAARRLETCLRTGYIPPTLRHNDLVARLQGDQFAILLDGLKEVGHAKIAADRILEEILAPFSLNGRDLLLSASIGVAVSATGYSRADDVLRDAETALHRAKLLGGSRCEVFDIAALQSAQAELQLEADFASALERREFKLFYQPIVSLASNEIVGLEALVRWEHPVLGLIPPVEFIPLAEKTAFIVPLGNWVLREACTQLKAWHEALPSSKGLWVSVNVSSLQFGQAGFVEEIGNALRDSSLEARCLTLELTESAAMENPTAVKGLLMQLRVMGVRISVDDFGTGHSSLASLRQFPVDALKVDRSFVRGIEANKGMADIFTAITTMARQLGLHVVAEGIENEDQLSLIRSLPCEYGQGYLFAKPLDHERVMEVLRAGVPPRQGSGEFREPAATVRPDETQVPQAGGRRSGMSRALYVAAAAVALLVVIGLPARVGRVLSPPPPSVSQPAAPTGTSAVVTENLAPGSQTGPAAGRAGGSALVARLSERVESATATDAAPGRAIAPARGPAPPAGKPPAPLRVVHQHRLGSCRGMLVVSRDGVAFVPDASDQVKDGFNLKHGEFLHVLDDDSLTIKSSDRTYRFKPAAATGEVDNRAQLERVVAGIANLRQGTGTR